MSSIRIYGLAGTITCLTLLSLGGCAREASDQMSWARAAGGGGTTDPLERRHDPFVCEGARLVHKIGRAHV